MIEEYRVLNNAVWERAKAIWLVNGVLISGSILIVLQTTLSRSNLDSMVAGFLWGLSSGLAFCCWLFYVLSEKVNLECWKRIEQIERILGIQGNRLIKSRVRAKWWYPIRSNMWYALLSLLVITFARVGFLFLRTSLEKIEERRFY